MIVASDADRIAIADVDSVLERGQRNGKALSYRLRLVEAVRGSLGRTIDLTHVWTHDTGPGGCARSYLYADPGDRIAIAWGRGPDAVNGPVSAVAIIRGTLDAERMPGMRRLTAAQVRAYAALPPTDAPGPSSSLPESPTGTWLLAMLGGLAAASWVVVRGPIRRRSRQVDP